ncbi:MAG TPA: DUF3179 domain-containing (seleno)protein [Thermoanaerobaculia bacterium]|nr:DUF3179 domain-containing (seleno)protein [Thermoanaerobaculia bacterium]
MTTPIPSRRAAGLTFMFAVLVLLAAEVLRIYWIMPFPGSQQGDTLGTAYALHRWIWAMRILAGAAALWAAARLLVRGRWPARVLVVLVLMLVGFVLYQANGPMSADVMFRQPTALTFATAGQGAVAPDDLVVGVALTGADGRFQARAYPIQLIGYHHQVRDVVAGQPVMVTYCTVCRTGRVFSPVVDGTADTFRLVGMDHWNAMFEDSRTGSWWRQVTGEAVAGPLKGKRLAEIPSRQMTWAAWSARHPGSDVMQPDPRFAARYANMEGYAEGTNEGSLTGRDPRSWQRKSWVVGALAGNAARAFDWNELTRERVLNDRVGDRPVVLLLGADGASFHAFDARPGGNGPRLELERTADPSRFRDRATGATWDESGLALDGPQAGTRLAPIPAYQEFWHSWQTFQPATTARGHTTS